MNTVLDTVLLGGVGAVTFVIVATLVLSAIGIWITEAAEDYARWVRKRVRRFFAASGESRVAGGEPA